MALCVQNVRTSNKTTDCEVTCITSIAGLRNLNISPSDPDIKSFILHIEGVTGDIVFDESADRQPDFALWHYNQSLDEFTTWAEIKVYNPPNQVRILEIIRFQ